MNEGFSSRQGEPRSSYAPTPYVILLRSTTEDYVVAVYPDGNVAPDKKLKGDVVNQV
jgi:hypothetical protein